MKHIRLIIATMALVFATIFTVQAQAPYHYGIGVTAGNMQALSFKACSGHFAFQLDLGTKIVCTNGRYSKHLSFEGLDIWDLELNPNFISFRPLNLVILLNSPDIAFKFIYFIKV